MGTGDFHPPPQWLNIRIGVTHKSRDAAASRGKMRRRTIFRDEAALDVHHVPRDLLHRENQLQLLQGLFGHMATAPYMMSQGAIIMGPVGAGKTLLAKYYGKRLREKAWERGAQVKYIHVNCREQRGSLHKVLIRVIDQVRPKYPERGFSTPEQLFKLREILGEEETQVLLCLDDVEVLIRREGAEPLYYLSRFHETLPEAPRLLNLVCISKGPEPFRGLDRGTLSSLQQNVLTLPEYSKDQLIDILEQRVKRAFKEAAVSPWIIDHIAGKATREKRGAGYALDVLRRSGKYADGCLASRIKPEHVDNAAAGAYPVFNGETIGKLTLHEQLTLLAVARFFKTRASPEATTVEIKDDYALVCGEYGARARKYTQYWKYLKTLNGLGLIKMEVRSLDPGRSHHISLKKVPAETLELEVKKQLLKTGPKNKT